MRKICYILTCVATALLAGGVKAGACTGISLKSGDGSRIVARTVEWAKEPMHCGYAVVPVGYGQTSLTPKGENGLKFKARYGYVGIYTEYEKFVVEGVNERGLSAGLFFFPGFGEYPEFDEKRASESLCDMQLVSWALSTCATIDELKDEMSRVRVTNLDSRIGTVHWRFSEPGGRVVVLEFKDGEARFFENPLGVLTNAPGFEWHMTNLRNYMNLRPGPAEDMLLGQSLQGSGSEEKLRLAPLGGGSGMAGLPGDFTPPSRFIRAAMLSATAPVLATASETVAQAFHILNNFDIPVGLQHPEGQAPEGLPSATQFTCATDLSGLRLYYRTAWNQNVRCIDLRSVDFRKVKYQTAPLDVDMVWPVEMITVKD